MPKGEFNAKLRLLAACQRTTFKELENVEQLKTMHLRIVPGCSLHLRLPECQGESPAWRLHVRSQLQVRSFVFLQEVLGMDRTPRTLPVRGVSSNGMEPLMHNSSNLLVLAGSACMFLALVLAWCLVGVRASPFMKSIFQSYQYLLKAHIDYLMMSGLLFVFFLLFAHFRLSAPPVIALPMIAGSVMNPVGFLVLAVKPKTNQDPASVFGVVMACSFTLTTVGYAGAAWLVARAAARAL